MNKKILILFLVSILVFCVICGGVLFLLHKSNENASDLILEERTVKELLNATTTQEITNAANEQNFNVEKYDDYNVVTVENFDGMKFQVIFTMKGNNVIRTDGSFEVTKQLKDIKEYDEIGQYISKINSICDEIFDYKTIDVYPRIYAKEGYPIDDEDLDTNKMIANGDANFALYVRDSKDTFWEFHSAIDVQTDQLVFGYTRYFDTEQFDDFIPDIVIE